MTDDQLVYDPDDFDSYGSFNVWIEAALQHHPVKPSGYEWESHREIYVPDPHDYRTYDEWDEAAWAHARLCVSDWYVGIRAIG